MTTPILWAWLVDFNCNTWSCVLTLSQTKGRAYKKEYFEFGGLLTLPIKLIHLVFSYLWSQTELEPVPGPLSGQKTGLPSVHIDTTTLTPVGNLKSAINLANMILDSERKPGNPEISHASKGRIDWTYQPTDPSLRLGSSLTSCCSVWTQYLMFICSVGCGPHLTR